MQKRGTVRRRTLATTGGLGEQMVLSCASGGLGEISLGLEGLKRNYTE